MKIALIQDQLLTRGGSERVFLYMAQEFSEADLFTLSYNPKTTWPEFRGFDIRTSRLDWIIRDHDRFKALYPISTLVMEAWDFRGYDLILTSSATTAKYIRKFDAPHLCYCYFPTRAIWTPRPYFGSHPSLQARLFLALAPWFKRRDLAAARRVGRFIGISEASRDAIRKYYGRDAGVLFSPIDAARFEAGRKEIRQDYFLLVSRLERWKLLDYAIEAFTRLGLPLRVVGRGPEESRLRAMAGPNVEFMGGVDDETLVRFYGAARGVIFTPELEYGLVPLEAVAAGTPVIALGRGGVLETMVDINDAAGRPATAVLFPDPTADSLIDAVRRFEKARFRVEDLVAHAAAFDVPVFKRRLRKAVDEFLAHGTIETLKDNSAGEFKGT